MNICSCVVHTTPEQAPLVAAQVAALPGVEVHGGLAEGRLIITLEDTGQALAADTLSALNQVSGVFGTTLIYHYGGSDDAPEEHHRP